jgi:hypothetical protein
MQFSAPARRFRQGLRLNFSSVYRSEIPRAAPEKVRKYPR